MISFRRSSHSIAHARFVKELQHELIGRSLLVEKDEGNWHLTFGADFVVVTVWLWRLIGADRILVTSDNDGQWFGLPQPVDAAAKINVLLKDNVLIDVDCDAVTGDLVFRFSGNVNLQVVSGSSGYETWTMHQRGQHFAVGASGGLV